MPLDYQPTFTGGEITPDLHSRTDLEKYATSLALARNYFIRAHGGAMSRAGFQYVYDMPDSDLKVRLLPFRFNVEQAYVLALTSGKLRVFRDGGIALEPNVTIAAITQANPAVVTSTSHGYEDGDQVFITGVVGMTELNNKYFIVANKTANTFQLLDTNSSAYSAYISDGSSGRVFELDVPYGEPALPLIKYTQSADVMTLAHPSFDLRNLSRTEHYAWTLDSLSFANGLTPPVAVMAAFNGATPSGQVREYRYVVTVVDEDGRQSLASNEITSGEGISLSTTWGMSVGWEEAAGAAYYNVYKELAAGAGIYGFIGESEPKAETVFTISGVTDTAAVQISTDTFHTFKNGDCVLIEGTGLSTIDDKYWPVSASFPNAQEFKLFGSTAGGTSVTGTATKKQSFVDSNLGPDMSLTPPIQNNPFSGSGNKPSAIAYHQQRRAFAGTNNNTQRGFLTRTAQYNNMDYSRPLQADDSIQFDLVDEEVQEIRHLVSMDNLVALTNGAEWVLKADENGVLTPANTYPDKQGRRGSSHVRPVVVGDSLLYVQERGNRFRDLNYQLERDKLVGDDLSLLAEHLFQGKEIVDCCYAQEPYSIIWAIRDDGVLLSLVYLKDQRVWGWSQHETQGFVESITCIPEGQEDVLYLCVRRTINGQTKRYIERMATRLYTNIEDYFGVDSGLTFTGSTTRVLVITNNSPGTVFCEPHDLVEDDVIWIKDVVGMDELTNQYIVKNVTANSFDLYDLNGRELDTTGFGSYVSGGEIQKCTYSLSNLDHLESETLVALADGNVVRDIVVTDGSVSFSVAAHKINIGLGYVCDMDTLDINFEGSSVIVKSRKMSVGRVALQIRETRGLEVGEPEGRMEKIDKRNTSMKYGRLPVITGTVYHEVLTAWSNGGRLRVRQPDPLPASILAIIPEVTVDG